MPGKENGSLNTALLPVLFLLSHGQRGGNPEKMLDDLIEFMQSAKGAMQAMKSSMETFQSGINMLASYTRANTRQPAARPVSHTNAGSPPDSEKTPSSEEPGPAEEQAIQ